MKKSFKKISNLGSLFVQKARGNRQTNRTTCWQFDKNSLENKKKSSLEHRTLSMIP